MDNSIKKTVNIDPSAYTPLYIQLFRILRDAIEKGLYKPGDRLPSENELIEQYAISRTTAIAAINEIVNARLAYRERGRGTFIAQPMVSNFSFHKSFTDIMSELGLRPSSRFLSLEEKLPDPMTAEKLKMPEDERYYRLCRIRLANDSPVALQTAYLTMARYPGLLNLDFQTNGLFDILRNIYQINPAWSEAIVEAAAVDPVDAAYLEVNAATPVLVVWHLTLDDKYQPIEYVRSIYRSDRFSFATGRSPILSGFSNT
jgi:GntR family transcriptional regulator